MAGDEGGSIPGGQQVWAWRDAYVAGGDIVVYQLGAAGEGAAGRAGVTGRVESPYKGLGAFGRDDAGFFFGRERAAASISERLPSRESGVLSVSGASGAGKSSLLMAGVLPELVGPQLVLSPAG